MRCSKRPIARAIAPGGRDSVDAAPAIRHLFITQDYPPMGGGMARRHVELCRRLAPDGVTVSTVAPDAGEEQAAAAFDAAEPYEIVRQPFPFRGAKTVFNQARWARWLVPRCAARPATTAPPAADIVHCGNIRPAGYPVWWAHHVTGVPYLVYVYGGDLLREQRKLRVSALKRWTARRIFEDSACVVAISDWSATLAADVMRLAGVGRPPRILTNALGTDPAFFHPGRGTGAVRARFAVGDAPLMLTVARLVPHKGIDIALRAMAALTPEWPGLRYLVAGRGEDGPRLAALAEELRLTDRVIFAGTLSDAEIAEAYASATLYIGLSRVDAAINAEGFGIAFVEAASSGTPSVAGDSGGVRSAVADGRTGLVVGPTDVAAVTGAIRSLLSDPSRRQAMGAAGRAAALSHFNWDRVADEVRAFAAEAVSTRRGVPARVPI
jgi:phosphatidylinositol alpha-1,6-mannosyltransferase